MNSEGTGKYNFDSRGHTYGYDYKGGQDIDTSDRTQREGDGGHIPGRYQFEETEYGSKDDEDSEDTKEKDDN